MSSDFDLLKIRKKFDNQVFQRGMSYFQEGRVLEVKVSNPDFEFTVKGSGRKKYTGFFRINEQGDLSRADCSCPYPYNCKHLAAAILAVSDQAVPPEGLSRLEQEIRDYRETSAQEIPRSLRLSAPAPGSEVIPSDLTSRIRSRASASQKYSLAWELVLFQASAYYSGLMLMPCLISIRQVGTAGRREDFREERLTELPPPRELELLEFTLLNLDHRQSLLSNFSVFQPLLHAERPLFFGGKPLTVLPFKTIRIEFSLEKDVQDRVQFHPRVLFQDSDHTMEIKSFHYLHMEYDHHTFLAFEKQTGLFYFQGEMPEIQLCCSLKKLAHSMSYHDIMVWYRTLPVKNSLISVVLPPGELLVQKILPQSVLRVDQSLYHPGLEIHLEFDYKQALFSDHVILEKDPAYELRIMRYLERLFASYSDSASRYGNSSGEYELSLDLRGFLLEFGAALLDMGFAVTLPRGQLSLRRAQGSVSLQARRSLDWFELELKVDETEGVYDLAYLEGGFLQKEEELILLHSEDLAKLKKWVELGLDQRGRMRVHPLDLQRIDCLVSQGFDSDPDWQSRQAKYRRLTDHSSWPELPPVQGFRGDMRVYQTQGVRWLCLLWKEGLSGILADDMGLGKTIQTLYFLLYLKETGKLEQALLIVPVTTLPNWEREIRRFTPSLSFVRHHGQTRGNELEKSADIILTSYHTLANDVEIFKNTTFSCLILDEAQNIKNPASRAFKSVRALEASFRLSLTGTPVENNTRELWAQMDFLFPGFLGSQKSFSTEYARPIEEQGDEAKVRLLQARCAPFILRRKKEEVLTDLPEKEEIILYCEMDKQQKKLYKDTAKLLRKKLSQELQDKGVKKSVVSVFDALLKLRQICLYPGLLEPGYEDTASIKETVLLDTMEELRQEGHKALIFSQFVKVLDRIQPHCDQKNWGYVRLDGSTRDRDKPVNRFQQDSGLSFFLISLKAGSTGINLTAADYVILFDPWWNPAVESQAMDRAHRIGQQNRVTVYRLIVKDTVEEKILALQERKKALVEDLLSTDSVFYSSLSDQEILGLFD